MLARLAWPRTVTTQRSVRPVPGAGHVLHEDAPDKVAEALRAFLSRHGLSSRAEEALLREKLRRARAAAEA